MGFRFFKRVQLAPGVTLNLSKSGVSLSVGPRGAKVTVGTGGAQLTLGVPGTGVYWTGKLGDVLGGSEEKSKASKANKASKASASRSAGASPPPEAEVAWVEGMEALQSDQLPVAVERLGKAWEGRAQLRGARSKREVTLPLTPEIVLALVPDRRGAGLGYAESLQASGKLDEAVDILRTLKTEADAPVVRAALAEIELERGNPTEALEACGRSRDPVVALYRARALLAAGKHDQALAEVARVRANAPEGLKDDLDEVEERARE